MLSESVLQADDDLYSFFSDLFVLAFGNDSNSCPVTSDLAPRYLHLFGYCHGNEATSAEPLLADAFADLFDVCATTAHDLTLRDGFNSKSPPGGENWLASGKSFNISQVSV